MNTHTRRRAGGRAERHKLRAAPLADDIRPVRSGLEGGQYRPLSDADMATIYAAAIEVLETVGLQDAPQSGVDAMVARGVKLGDDGRLRFPAKVVEWAREVAAKPVTLYGRDPAHDLRLEGHRVHYGTAGAAVNMVDTETGTYRESDLQDLYDATRLADALDNIHFVQRPIVARDVTDNYELDINTAYACAAATVKHVGTSIIEAPNVAGCIELLHLVAGGEAAWRDRPFMSNSNCFVVPPLKFATESCLVMEEAIKGGMPVLLLSAGQAGATAPAPIAGAIVQAVAECLAGLVYVNALVPGHTAIFGTWPFVSDLRTGAMSGGSGEQALLTAGCAQMGHYLGLSMGAAAGIADAKLPDMQAGWEQATSNVMAGLSGLNMVYEAAGMHASLLGFCLDSLVLGDDLIGQSLRCVRGIEVTPETLSIQTMHDTCIGGPGHYLGHAQTLGLMQTEYVYPAVADRSSPKEWEEKGRPELLATARARREALLAMPPRAALAPEVDAEIRRRFKIHLRTA
ncbi:MAG: trimethylamine methyltransferase family protein [Rhodobacteraceae bacterium]|nr:trimethylamine methyltransferase family protein [Paracoccaceae bacterium]